MERQKALELIEEMISAEIEVVHSCNSTRGLTKKAANRECNAARALFMALTGAQMTSEEFNEIRN